MADMAEDDTGLWSPIYTTAAFAALQGVIVYALFEYWRTQKNKQGIYQPRQTHRPHRSPEEPSPAPFAWIKSICKVNDEELHRMVGMDHYVLLRHCIFGFRLTLFPSIVAVFLMAFVYRYGGLNKEEYNEFTMANVEAENFRLWYSVGFMYIVVLWALVLMWKEWANFVPKRFAFLSEGDPDMDREVSYAALVENIPEDKRSSPALYGYFDQLFPGKVSYASLCMLSGNLESILNKTQDAIKKIEHAVAQKHLDTPKEDKTRIGGVLCCGGEKVDTEMFYRGELKKFITEANKEHARISQVASEGAGSSVASSTGFVVFTSIATKLAATGLNVSEKHGVMDTKPAPAPSDVLWDNVTVPYREVSYKRFVANCLWSMGILFWAIPVVFVLGIADLNELSKRFSWLWVPEPGTLLNGLISGLLPVVALAVLTALVPIVIRLAAIKFIRFKSEADVDLYVFKWHFGFRVANLWLIIIGGSIINRLDGFVDDPGSIVDLLGASVPTKSQFFMSILLVSLLSGLAMDLSRIVPVIVSILMGALSDEKGKSDRELRDANIPPSLNWGVFYPPLLFALLVVYCYAPLAPLVVPVACLLYGGSYLVYKNQALYVYVQTADTGGEMMYLMHSFMMGCMYVGEIVFVAFVGIKQGARQGVLAIVLVFITLIWHLVVNKKFVKMSRVQCLEAAVSADKKFQKGIGQRGSSDAANHPFDGKAYVQSSLKKAEWETEPEGYRDSATVDNPPDP